MTTRPLFSEDAEEAVLGAMILDERAILRARAAVRATEFYRERNQRLFDAVLELHGMGRTVDPLTLATHLEERGQLAACGGREHISYLLDAVPTTDNVEYHAAIVRERAGVRGMLDVFRGAIAQLEEGGMTASEAAQAALNALLPHATATGRGGFRHVREFVWPVLEAIEARHGAVQGGEGSAAHGAILCGFPSIDNRTNGFRPGELVILGGAEKSGKTMVALNIAQRVLELGSAPGATPVGVGIVSAEMTAENLLERIISRQARIPASELASGRFDESAFPRLARVAGQVVHDPLWIDDEAEPSLADVAARCSYLKASHPEIRLIVVDFLQLLHAREKGQSEAVELKRIAYGLKGLAKRLGVVVIAPCQVNSKDIEELKTPKPRLKDLQGSSGMRQAADFIALVYRPGMYDGTSEDDTLELNFAASRRVSPFVTRLRWHGATMTVQE
jgi:replicative DNA helicase